MKLLSCLPVLLAMFLSVAAAADEKPAVSVIAAGTWTFEVFTGQGSGTPVFTLKQEEDKLTGQYRGVFGEAPVAGSVNGVEVRLIVKTNAQGEEIIITYIGRIEGDEINGRVSIGNYANGWFTGKRESK
jgi:D-glucosaminate-6-phosphate ammonia-lyase